MNISGHIKVHSLIYIVRRLSFFKTFLSPAKIHRRCCVGKVAPMFRTKMVFMKCCAQIVWALFLHRFLKNPINWQFYGIRGCEIYSDICSDQTIQKGTSSFHQRDFFLSQIYSHNCYPPPYLKKLMISFSPHVIKNICKSISVKSFHPTYK